jgi:hypothetical protein
LKKRVSIKPLAGPPGRLRISSTGRDIRLMEESVTDKEDPETWEVKKVLSHPIYTTDTEDTNTNLFSSVRLRLK